MKIVILSFGYSDSILPLYKKINQNKLDVNLIFCFALNRKSDAVLDFTEKKIYTGFLSDSKVQEILSAEIKAYLRDISTVKFFIYYNLKLRSLKNFFLSFKLVSRLRNYDIIHFNGTNGVLPLLILLLRKKKMVFTIHDIKTHSGEKSRFNLVERMNEYIIKSKYPLIVHNHSDYEYLRFKYSNIVEKFKFIPFGVLDIFREFKSEKSEAVASDVLFFGRIAPYKGIEYLIDAIKYLHYQGKNVKTIIAGEGSIYFHINDLEKFGIKLINRYIKNEELANLIECTKVVVCPYTDATQSGVIMTAFAFNKPAIASDVGSFREVIIDGINGFLVQPKDKVELALKINILLSNPNLLEYMSNSIRLNTISGEYSWNQIAEEYNRFYTKIYNGNPVKRKQQ